MSIQNFKVISSNVTKNNNFCNKISCKADVSVATAFGNVTQSKSLTYYLFTEEENKIGMEAELDIALFDVVEKPFTISNEETGEDEEIQLKYLYPKA